MADVRSTPISNYPAYYGAGLLSGLNEAVSKPFGYENDPVRALTNLLGIPGIVRTLENTAYGMPNVTGAGMATQLRPEAKEAAATLLPMAPGAGRLAVSGAIAGGKYIAPKLGQMAEQYVTRTGLLQPIIPNNISGNVTPTTRNLFDEGWYHGTTGDIRQFRKDLLGEATGAKSAEEGFFFARDPRNPPKEMTVKSNDPETIAFLKRLGKTDEEIAAMNTVSMKGHGAHTASGYAQLGGDREYREAMRLASIAEKKGNWPEYEKQSAIAENLAINKNNQMELLIAKAGDARDQMMRDISKSLNISSPEAFGGLNSKNSLPYGWYNSEEGIKSIKNMLSGKEGAQTAIKSIDKFRSVVAERLALDSQSGANVLPVALRYKNPMYYDFKGSAYRDQTYADLVKEAKAKGHDALILQNTYDPGAGTAKLIDVGVVFDPAQIRSKFAKFDPKNINSPDVLAAGIPFGLLGGAEVEVPKKQEKKPKK